MNGKKITLKNPYYLSPFFFHYRLFSGKHYFYLFSLDLNMKKAEECFSHNIKRNTNMEFSNPNNSCNISNTSTEFPHPICGRSYITLLYKELIEKFVM